MTLSLVVSDSYYSSNQRGKAGPQLKSLLELGNHTSFSIAKSLSLATVQWDRKMTLLCGWTAGAPQTLRVPALQEERWSGCWGQ